mmetsp:Transcript_46149/g.119750  ORF Transcript_46149/g.119750 Transcript_46149/m.119750 type:complete len:372 (-) Transcript_46149:323-1438(-)
MRARMPAHPRGEKGKAPRSLRARRRTEQEQGARPGPPRPSAGKARAAAGGAAAKAERRKGGGGPPLWGGGVSLRTLPAQVQPGGDDAVGVQGHGVDALVHEPLGQLRLVGGALAADADVLALLLGGLDEHRQALHHRRVLLVEVLRHQAGVAVQAEGQLREVVAPDGEAVEVLQELLGQEDVRGQLRHHVHLQPVDAALQAVLLQDVEHVRRHVQRAHERDHQLHIRHAHVLADPLHGLQLQGEALLEGGVRVAAAAAEADHGVLLVGLVRLPADEGLVLVGLEVREAHDDALRVHGGRQGRHALRDLRDVELHGRLVPLDLPVDDGLRLGVDGVVIEQRLRVDADRVVDYKLQSGKSDALVRDLPELEGG